MMQKAKSKEETQKYLYDPEREKGSFAVVAVATNGETQQKLFEMGADVVILSEIAPSSQDFVDAFKLTLADKILVFPNCSNSILSAKQACKLCRDAKVAVLNSRSFAECYASLSVMDFEGDLQKAIDTSNQTISGMHQLSIYRATRDRVFGKKRILQKDFFALSNNQILDVSTTLEDVTLRVVQNMLGKNEYCVVSLFYGKSISEEIAEWLSEKIEAFGYDVEVAVIPTYEANYDLTVTFE